MSEQLYRLATANELEAYESAEHLWVVPVDPCEHGNYDRHLVTYYDRPEGLEGVWCEGAGLGGDNE